MRNEKMNNKGFSLVELIIVIAIMAILAAALAPQLMKYIDKSRTSTDTNTCGTLESTINTALSEEAVNAEIIASNGATLTFDTFPVTSTNISGAGTNMSEELAQSLSNLKAPKASGKTEYVATITVDATTKGIKVSVVTN